MAGCPAASSSVAGHFAAIICTWSSMSVHWSRYLRFRDALRANPALRDAYAELKRALAGEFPRDREAYIAGKTDFVERVLLRGARVTCTRT